MRGNAAVRSQAKRVAKEYRRDACSTRRPKGTGGTPAPLRRASPGSRCIARGRGDTPPRFCETKPVVMCGKQGLSSCCERRWTHYRKMTTGFVFREIGAVSYRFLRRFVELGHDRLTRNGRTLQ